MSNIAPVASTSKTVKTKYSNDLVDEAIFTAEKRRKGVSLPKIKKYLSDTYQIDTKKNAKKMCTYINNCLNSEFYINVTGKGCTGLFKLSEKYEKELLMKSKAAKKNAKSKLLDNKPKTKAPTALAKRKTIHTPRTVRVKKIPTNRKKMLDDNGDENRKKTKSNETVVLKEAVKRKQILATEELQEEKDNKEGKTQSKKTILLNNKSKSRAPSALAKRKSIHSPRTVRVKSVKKPQTNIKKMLEDNGDENQKKTKSNKTVVLKEAVQGKQILSPEESAEEKEDKINKRKLIFKKISSEDQDGRKLKAKGMGKGKSTSSPEGSPKEEEENQDDKKLMGKGKGKRTRRIINNEEE